MRKRREMQLFKPNISEAAIEATAKVLRSGWIGLGPKVAEFEEKFAKYVGAKYAVATNSCTSALHLALIVSDTKDGDEVITTPLTFVSTNHVILYQRAIPVFADIDPRTYCISPESIKKMITNKTKAIICMHHGGHPCNLDRIYAIAKKHNLRVIEDAAHACGSVCKGKKIGSLGLTCFSFHAVKNLPVGDGGMVTTNDGKQYERLKKLRWLGINKDTYSRTKEDKGKASSYAWKYDVPELGYKYHMNDITAAIGIEQLKLVEEQNAYRRKLAGIYNQELHNSDIISLPYVSPDVITSQHLYVIQIKRRDDLIAKLKENEIAPGVHYIPNNTFPMYRNCKADVKNAIKTAKNIISLPMHTLLTKKDVYKVIRIINEGW
ncbi:DegT/DnrJ/EryC1/StrS family aminotransferase [candidate division WOR-3 bacterium]|nr:DegT/DnrJ/EryC1/StrS family aminotransferase [candidate division WOR-3 bacterium]